MLLNNKYHPGRIWSGAVLHMRLLSIGMMQPKVQHRLLRDVLILPTRRFQFW